MQALNNYSIRIVGIITLTLLKFSFYSSDAVGSKEPVPASVYFETFLMSLILTIVVWECNRLLVAYFNKKYPHKIASYMRFIREAIAVVILNFLIYVAFLSIMLHKDPNGQPPFLFLLLGLLDRIIYGFLVTGFYELILFTNALRVTTKEAEELKKVNLAMQLESLKNQVKPHFLFNSLNTLTGLVEKDSRKAVKFIAELSNVYRYLLQSNEKEIIDLKQEMQFTMAYFFLLQTRFGEGIQLDVKLSDQHYDLYLPPLTVQMLLENAVKHNQASPQKPLRVKITADDSNWLTVENNLQLKRNAASNGMGLSNIAAKFKLLGQNDLEIHNNGEYFIIKVPLIKTQL